MRKISNRLFFWPLVASILLVILQLNPYSGLFLMMAGGGFLTGIAFLAFLAGLTIDCLNYKVSRVFLIIPLGFLAWYYSLVIEQRFRIFAYESEASDTNPQLLLKFDPQQHSLVTKHADELVISHKIPVVFSRSNNYKDTLFLSYRVEHSETCKSIPKDSLSRIGRIGFRFRAPNGEETRVRNLCRLRFPERPTKKIVEVHIKEPKIWLRKATIEENIFTLIFEGKELGQYRTGVIYRYPLLPFPFFACGLNSGAPSWDCGGGFRKRLHKLDTTPRMSDIAKEEHPIAIMLGLKRYSLSDLKEFKSYPLNQPALRVMRQESIRVTERVFHELERLMRTPNVSQPFGFEYSLVANKEYLRVKADRLVKAFIIFVKEAERHNSYSLAYENANATATAIAGLPPEQFAKYSQKIFNIIRKSDWTKRRPSVYIRAADAGQNTFVKYKSDLIGRTVLRPFASALAICRLPRIDNDVRSFLKSEFIRIAPDLAQKNEDYHEALFLALIRHGERNAVKSTLENYGKNMRRIRWYNKVLESHHADRKKMPNNCMIVRWQYKYLPDEMSGRYR